MSNSASAGSIRSAWLQENADVYRAATYNSSYLEQVDWSPEELNDPALTKVTREFGKTMISLDKLPIRSGRIDATKKVWGSYWYPHFERDLFESPLGIGLSTLEKYDQYRIDTKRIPSKAVEFEKMRHSSAVNRWEGLCDAWSIASVLLPEPVEFASYKLKDNKTIVRFTVGDQKALLFKTFEGVSSADLQIYGQRFDGGPSHVVNSQSFGWIQPDLYPDQFHRFLEVVLMGRKQPFVMDHDPSEAVWSEPVDAMSTEILPIAGRFDQVLVRTLLFPAKQQKKETRDVPGKNEHIREYNYILGGTVDWQRNLRIEYGIWLSKDYVTTADAYKHNRELHAQVRADSRRSHPDFVYVVPDSLRAARKPANPEIDSALVDSIVKPAVR